jgi:hypothetical protein
LRDEGRVALIRRIGDPAVARDRVRRVVHSLKIA